ncbi:MAG TPA: hypothetical protein VK966_01620 [Longimicrobiales bacterium]|nr:hypothetical protein [Longimicrobiales bacterium]
MTDTAASLTSTDSGTAPDAAADLVLTGQGLRLERGAGANGGPWELAFETPRDTALEVLATILGEPGETGEVADCAADYATWETGLTAWFARGRFVGWHVRERGLATRDGVAIGSTRAELDQAGGVEVRETSLGTEFTLDGIAGLLQSGAAAAEFGESAVEPDGQGAVVTHLWAGHTCIAR